MRKSKLQKLNSIFEFLIIVHIESLILDQGQEYALKCAFAYIEVRANGIMIVHVSLRTCFKILELLSIVHLRIT